MKEIHYSNFLRRFVAFIIDINIIILLNTIFSIFIILFIKTIYGSEYINKYNFEIISSVSISVLFILYILYFSISESSHWKGSIGKIITKIEIINLEGSKINFYHALVRTLLKIFSLAFYGYIFIFFSKRKQALHDFIIKTIVIHKQK